MKILVGLLVTIENEYEQCIQSIHGQTYKNYSIHEIRDKPKNTAHDLLYSYFMNNSNKFDLMLHIGPDMIIESNTLFKDIVKEFESNKALDRLFIPCYDHFVGENMGGVNIYRNTVKWEKNKDNYFTDRNHIDSSIRNTKKINVDVNMPLIHHCPDPSPFQAFHFGLHRMMKVIQPGVLKANIQRGHWKSLTKVLERYNMHRNNNLKYAIMGADCALKYRIKSENISYGDKKVLNLFEHYMNQVEIGATFNNICSKFIKSQRLPFPYNFWIQYFKYRVKTIFGIL